MKQPKETDITATRCRRKGRGKGKTKTKHKKLLEIENTASYSKQATPRYNIRAPLIQEIAEN
jgi:hypothetical protein